MNLPDLLLPYELSDEAAAHITEMRADCPASSTASPTTP
jgi:hypothetical protein